MKRILVTLLLLVSSACFAQQLTQSNNGFITGTQCVTVSSAGLSSGGYGLSGTWTGTISVYGAVGQATATLLASQTTNGSFTIPIPGYTQFKVCGNTIASGTAFVQITASITTLNVGSGSASVFPVGTDSGVVNAYVVANLFPAMTSLANGNVGCFVPANANTNGVPTVNFSGLGAITIAKMGGALFATNELVTTKLACMYYDAAAANFKLLNPNSFTGTGSGVQATSPVFVTKISTPFVQINGTTFTTNAGCGEGALVGGVSAGKITTAGQTSCTDIITIATAATNGWQCSFTDLTTAASAANPHQTATTTTTVTWVSGTIVAADVIQFACTAY